MKRADKSKTSSGAKARHSSGTFISPLSPAPYALLFAGVFILYYKTVFFGFIPTWDDGRLVIENTLIRLVSFENISAIFTSSNRGFYQPLHILSYMIDHAVWGLNPAGYHLSNVLLHAVNACLVFALASRITGRAGISFFAAALFAVHPVNVENAAWVAERKTLLSTAFSLLSVYFYIDGSERKSHGRYIVSLLLFIAALLSKVMAVTVPLVLLAYHWTHGGRERMWIRLAPFFAFAMAAAALTLAIHLRTGVFESGTLSADVLFGTVYPTMLPIFWKYIGLLALPFGLSGYYDAPLRHSFAAPPVALAMIGLIFVFVIALWRGNREVRFWFLWYWILLLPFSNIIPNIVFYADRFLYLPQIGLFVLLGMMGEWIMTRFFQNRSAVIASAAMIVIVLAALSFNRADVWANELSFWADTAAKSPDMYKPRLNLGVAYEKAGMLAEAEKEYEAALRIYRGQEAVSNLAMLRAKMKSSGGR